MPKCLITGCYLYVENENKAVYGDLHQLGDVYVFNACLQDGETAWVPIKPYQNTKCLVITGEYFERRGVIVVAVCDAEVNATALEYLK
jgi:hypothetical protein